MFVALHPWMSAKHRSRVMGFILSHRNKEGVQGNWKSKMEAEVGSRNANGNGLEANNFSW